MPNINLNNSSKDELKKLNIIEENLVDELIQYREEHGKFKNWGDVIKIPNFSQEIVDKLRQNGATIE
ncbi:hypothetical protein CO172_01395 [Candidatus Uhrbacteria bacterium CG_4_9_14_3_um_filter_36_7]|uniref:Competence protein ComEA n=1 Tax=Candidatus Uhrbacteria bacterium CG_4_9_14_3_um_filter_36_7 TaxID=1975033 RepID=A0A2M7XHW7_9BACT|nr:MAG: hypothetical protein CO172_01395 [Candidatus Uhrbacteria bacterium CG_4_9_14_3_um_filter_36_7]